MQTVSFGPSHKVELLPDGHNDLEFAREKAKQLRLRDVQDPYFLVDLGDVVTKYRAWRKLLPRVQPFYAVKCNTDVGVLTMLDTLGAGFDCASKGEISHVLKLGVDPSKIIYAQPYKPTEYVRYASTVGVDFMTFDSAEELDKISEIFPTARLVLRIRPPEHSSIANKMGNKFGCPPDDVGPLLQHSRRLGLNVVGASFHVGGGGVAEAFLMAVETAAMVFKQAKGLGFELKLLDIGGGFPPDIPTFEKIALDLNRSLDVHFPAGCDVTLIAEPGRYLVATAFTLTATVIAKRRVTSGDVTSRSSIMYYINDGVYGSFGGVVHDAARSPLDLRLLNPPVSTERLTSTVWGPTSASDDVLFRDVRLPEMRVGDVINLPEMGAYSLTLASDFHETSRPGIVYYCSKTVWNGLFPNDSTLEQENGSILSG